MNQALAGEWYWHVREAREGAALCRSRILETTASAPLVAGTEEWETPVRDLRSEHSWMSKHDLAYYAWEAVRILNIARRVVKARARGHEAVQAASDVLIERAPLLRSLRDALTHPEDNRGADDLFFTDSAARLRPGGAVEYHLDVRGGTHDALENLVRSIEAALEPALPPGDRYDNSGRDRV